MKRFIPLFNFYQGGSFRGKYTWGQPFIKNLKIIYSKTIKKGEQAQNE